MTLDSNIASDVQEFDVGNYVELYEFDLTSIGGSIGRFTPHTKVTDQTAASRLTFGDSPLTVGDDSLILSSAGSTVDMVYFAGEYYVPINCKVEGFEMNSRKQLPRPVFTVSIMGDKGYALRSLIRSYDDLIGVPFTRRRTLEKYLFTETAIEFPQDIYVVERKIHQNNMVVQWELSAFMDHQGKKLPNRLILKDTCTHVYRYYSTTTGTFDYTRATCPYTGSSYYDATGASVTISNDKCGKRISDCKLRFPSSALPTRAFPGVSRVRIR